jgi:hypothetical protein
LHTNTLEEYAVSTFRAEVRRVRDVKGYTGLGQRSGQKYWPIRAKGMDIIVSLVQQGSGKATREKC